MLESDKAVSGTLQITDMYGRVQLERAVDHPGGVIMEEINTAIWTSGTYIVQWVSDEAILNTTTFSVE